MKTKARLSRYTYLRIAQILCSLLILLALSVSILRDLTTVIPPEIITIAGNEVIVDRTLPKNGFDRSLFTTDARDRTSYSGCATRTGVDVSVHQGDVDWKSVAADNIDFAILRIGYRGYSEGTLNPDEQFDANLSGAQANGLDTGIYFFSQAININEAVAEADYVLSLLKGRPLELPIYFDWELVEFDTARTDSLDGDTLTDCAVAFCTRIEAAGYQPAIYCNGTVAYFYYDLHAIRRWPMWYANYQESPDYVYDMSIWQYSSTSYVNGITGETDLNLMFLPTEPTSEPEPDSSAPAAEPPAATTEPQPDSSVSAAEPPAATTEPQPDSSAPAAEPPAASTEPQPDFSAPAAEPPAATTEPQPAISAPALAPNASS